MFLASVQPLIRRAALALLVLLGSAPLFASSLTITTGDLTTGNHVGNLIVNGSFETGNPGTDLGWTPGTHVGSYPSSEVSSIPGWTSNYPAGAYGWWGPFTGFYGGTVPDGNNVVYFGNSINNLGTSPTVAPNGEVTLAGAPTFNLRPGPVTLEQTVTGLNTSATYRLDFWTSGEGNNGPMIAFGLFGLEITGFSTTYLMVPNIANAFGVSQRYYVDFTPTSSSTTFRFLNWGHINDVNGFGSELVLDDVILNQTSSTDIPSPAASIVGLAGLGLLALRRRAA